MNKFDLQIWNREFSLYGVLQMYPGIEVTSKQIETLNSINGLNLDKSLEGVKEYIFKKNGNDLLETEIKNIFRYVMPKQFYIPRNPDGMLALMCNYRFDPEHGIAVIFIDGQFKKVCSQDEVL